MHIGRKSRIGIRSYFCSAEARCSADGNAVLGHLNRNTYLAKLCADRFHVLGNYVFDANSSARSRGGYHICSRLYHIGSKLVGTAVELLYSLYSYHTRSRTRDLCTAGVEEARHIHDVRLSCGVFYYGSALGKYRGKHNIDGRADRGDVKINEISAKPVGRVAVYHSTAREGDPRSERLKALDVKVDGAKTEITSAGVAHLSLAKSAEHSAEQIYRASHLADVFERRALHLNAPRVYNSRRGVYESDVCAYHLKRFKRERNVAYVREIFDSTHVVCGDSAKDDGEGRVFHSAYIYVAVKRLSAANDKLFHNTSH